MQNRWACVLQHRTTDFKTPKSRQKKKKKNLYNVHYFNSLDIRENKRENDYNKIIQPTVFTILLKQYYILNVISRKKKRLIKYYAHR